MSFFSKLNSFFTSCDTNTNYESFIETKLLTPNTTTGFKSEITKHITPSFSITSSYTLSDKLLKYFSFTSTFIGPNYFIQNTIDQERNLQNRFTAQINNLIIKAHSLYSKTNGSYSQLELNNPFLGGNLGYKIISPAIKEVSPIQVINYVKKLKNIYVGLEGIFTTERNKQPELGISLALKKESPTSELALTIQQLTSLNICYLRSFNPLIKMGIDFNYSLLTKENNSNVYLLLKSRRTEIRSQIEKNGKIFTSIEEKMNDNLNMSLSVESDLIKGCTYIGMGFSLLN